jgi:endonuclease/exonuclease/phosphatase family metal-dependent hydrolase
VHLSLSADERGLHLPELWRAVDRHGDVPLVVAGDINEEPGGPVWGELSSRLVDAWSVHQVGAGHTYSATSPRKRIDGIFADRTVEVVECRVVDDAPGVEVASDHLPVLAVLRRNG